MASKYTVINMLHKRVFWFQKPACFLKLNVIHTCFPTISNMFETDLENGGNRRALKWYILYATEQSTLAV